MASKLDTATSAQRLHAALLANTRDPLFGSERLGLFEQLRLQIADATKAFAERPAHGESALEYDAPLAACDKAAALASAALPKPGQDRSALIGAVDQAAQALGSVTSAAHAFAWLSGALRVNVAPRQAPAPPIDPEAPQALGLVPAAPNAAPPPAQGGPGDPNYYQKLTNLFPAEGLALYGTGVALYSGANAIVVIGTLVVLGVLRWVAYGANADDTASRSLAVAIAAASFLLWATAADPKWLEAFVTLTKDNAEQTRRGTAFAGAAAVLLAPLIVKVPTKS